MTDDFEREKWRAEYDLRKRELELKEREAVCSRWSNPLVVAVFAAALAGMSNAVAIWFNGMQARNLEETRAEAARILEVMKTGNSTNATYNLKFLLDAGLIADPERRNAISQAIERESVPALPLPQPRWIPGN